MQKISNYAFLDWANLHRWVKSDGWEIDYARFRVWLRERHHVTKAYLFLGLLPEYRDLYLRLQEDGYILVFKKVTQGKDGSVKWNCDADLVLNTVRSVYESEFNSVVIVSGDGDFESLVRFLQEKQKMSIILAPNKHCSSLLRNTNARITYLRDVAVFIWKEKAPR